MLLEVIYGVVVIISPAMNFYQNTQFFSPVSSFTSKDRPMIIIRIQKFVIGIQRLSYAHNNDQILI